VPGALRTFLFALACASCSGGGGESGGGDRRPTKAGAAPAKALELVRDPQPDRSAAEVWTGTFEGRTEPAPAPLPSRNVAKGAPAPDAGPESSRWSGDGTLRLEATGESVAGTLEGGGLSCKVGGSLVAGKLRAWLRAEGAAGMQGNLQGAAEGDAIRGAWRVSSSGGVEVRAGSFEIRRGN
jgi:hypothetical protein